MNFNTRRQGFLANSLLRTLLLTGVAVFYTGAYAQPKETVAQKKVSAVKAYPDLLAGDVWHAYGNSWPGTLTFTEKGKKVLLKPVGADPIEATYAFAVQSSTPAIGKQPPVQRGVLTLTDKTGRTSEAQYVLTDDNQLSLRFKGGPRDETYIKMTPDEEEMEKERIKKLMIEMDKNSATKK